MHANHIILKNRSKALEFQARIIKQVIFNLKRERKLSDIDILRRYLVHVLRTEARVIFLARAILKDQDHEDVEIEYGLLSCQGQNRLGNLQERVVQTVQEYGIGNYKNFISQDFWLWLDNQDLNCLNPKQYRINARIR